jgi:hypothetical protein
MPRNPNGGAPQKFALEDVPLQDIYEANGTTLEDDIVLDFWGKTKTITKGNGDTIEISPGSRGTLTNNDTDEVFDFVATGNFQYSDNGDGTTDVTINGLNLQGNPYVNDGSYALVQTRGHFNYTFDPAGADFSEQYSPLEGNGQILFIVDDLVG